MNRLTSWFWDLSKSGKVAVVLVYFVIFGGAVGTIVYAGGQTQPVHSESAQAAHDAQHTLGTHIEKRTVMTFNEDMPFAKKKVEDPALAEGTSFVRTAGVNGKRNATYEVTYTDGQETDRKLLEQEILEKPVDEVTVVGTYKAPEQTPQVQGIQTRKETTHGNDTALQAYMVKKIRIKKWRGPDEFECIEYGEEYYDLRPANVVVLGEYSTVAECEASLLSE